VIVLFGADEVAERRRGSVVAACEPMGESNESPEGVRHGLVLHETEDL